MWGQESGSVAIKLIFPFQITVRCEASWKVGSWSMKSAKIDLTWYR